MVFGIIEGLFGGGGGGGGTSYSVSTTVQGGKTPVGLVSTLQGGDTPVGLVSTVQGGESPLALVSTLQGGERAVEVDVGLDDVNVDIGGTDTPLHSILDLRLPQPLRTETDLDVDTHLDVEPVQVDLCLDVGFSRLPRARIDQPWKGRFGVRVLGLELVGYEWSGRAGTVIDDLETRPHVELGPAPAAGSTGHRPAHHDHHDHRDHDDRGRGHQPRPDRPDGGLHVRVG